MTQVILHHSYEVPHINHVGKYILQPRRQPSATLGNGHSPVCYDGLQMVGLGHYGFVLYLTIPSQEPIIKRDSPQPTQVVALMDAYDTDGS